ncbi:G-type lectin S-receptor-like serine/threonine-protein kinase CES101 isoform X2 [Lycium ferocissimum]|uniref:G-type lectin S-receptor-like serine/threonine-protein kinase CES101 isoform X2 n=1 Tax=Lycium ferocissimum TaxID=112874 RepID=UPI0028152963|nr:G-type lectin S-receptor-like serine/threonine-protein kinase CES101 isoform X2 [Lycium ferocissimum]
MAWLQILLFFLFMTLSYSQKDTIFQGQNLRVGEKLESPNKEFRLEFFSLDANKTHYIGIFYNLPSNTTLFPDDYRPVWVANRDNPIPYASSNNLTLDEGDLKIIYGSDSFFLFRSSNDKSARNASATLLDNGNFVLEELNTDGSVNQTWWQSFDHPTDTLLPGMRLGRNSKTGQIWSLTSWISKDIPASGSFTIGINTTGIDQLIIWWMRSVFWMSGPWENGTFANVSRISHYDYADLSFVSTEDEKYVTYSVNKSKTLSRYAIDVFGFIKERGAAGPFGVCFYKPSAGCVTRESIRCPIRNNSWFERRPNSVSGNRFRFLNNNTSLFDCKRQCENNCSCAAFNSITATGTGCEIWSNVSILDSQSQSDVFILDGERDLVPIRNGSDTNVPSTFSPPPASPPAISPDSTPRSSDSSQRTWKAKATALLLLNQTANRSKKGKIDKKMSHEVQLYSLDSLAIATNNFSPGNKLGEGGFGPVYKGELPDGQEVAIKRLSTSSGQGLLEFKNEILLIAKLQHTNLVRLLGFCTQGEERILVYEYMLNKSLDFFLFDSNKRELLNWDTRFRIIEGVAQGLLYLHKYSRLKVIHRDLKSSNILLDADMNPKISDFGMARIFGRQESEANTKRIVGTHGYMSPEYALRGIVSTKTDVFSFGVLLLEIVSGKKNNSCYDSEHPLNLIGLAWELWREERALELIDATLIESCSHDEVMRCIHVGLLCVQDYAKDRPSMSSVVSMLMNDTRQPPPAPERPGFFIERGDQRAEISEEVVRYSINGLSISELTAR